MKVEYDEIYNQWVVWEFKGNTMTEVFKSKLKKECMSFVKKAKKRGEGSTGTKSAGKRVFSQIGDLSELSCKKK